MTSPEYTGHEAMSNINENEIARTNNANHDNNSALKSPYSPAPPLSKLSTAENVDKANLFGEGRITSVSPIGSIKACSIVNAQSEHNFLHLCQSIELWRQR